MRVFVMRKIWRFTFGMTICLMFILAVIGILYYQNNEQQARVDRSNAMRVTKSVANEQTLPVISTDFFTEYRLERDRIRSEKTDLLREVLKNANNDNDRNVAQDKMLRIIADKQRESEMENLIRSRGFADALVFVRDSSVSAVIKTPSLAKEDVVQIADIISRISGIRAEDIAIIAKP